MRQFTTAFAQFDTHSYPATTTELIDVYGDIELTHPNGTETLGDVLGRLDTETFESPEEARFAAISAVDSAAIGRKHYSDRDPSLPGEDGPEPLSI